MFAFIKGILIEATPHTAVIETAGIGFLIHIPQGACSHCLPLQEVLLHLSFLMQQEQPTLYGFIEKRHRQLFDLLVGLPGIGPKTALALLSQLPFEQFMQCVLQERKEWLHRVPGIGKKTADRLLLEIKDKLPKEWLADASQGAHQDAIAALVHLGYSRTSASKAVQEAATAGVEELSVLITEALKRVER